jgi:hypothetical protein
MKHQRRMIDVRVKLEVVRMIEEQGLSVGHVTQSVDIPRTLSGKGQALPIKKMLLVWRGTRMLPLAVLGS